VSGRAVNTRGDLRAEIDALKARVALSALVGRAVEWDRRRSNAGRGDWWACCPFHTERTPSFHVDDRRGFYHCFGCAASGDHLRWLMDGEGLEFRAALARLREIAGVAAPERRWRQPPRAVERHRAPGRALAEARRIWRAARPESDVLMDYLAARGVRMGVLEARWGGPPPAIRFHPALPYWEAGRVVQRGPAMVALIGWPECPVGVHRTWITREGRARHPRTGRKLDKRWLGLTGRMFGRAVRITLPSRRMLVGEGIETVLAAWSMLRAAGEDWSAEAALSLGALTGRADAGFGPGAAVPDWDAPGWRAPDWVEELVILGEGSAKAPDEAARRFEMARRRHAWRSDGTPRLCRVVLPAGGWASGLDFADVAAGRAA